MQILLLDGPFAGANYALSELRSTKRLPDVIGYEANDRRGNNVQHQYRFHRVEQCDGNMVIYKYNGYWELREDMQTDPTKIAIEYPISEREARELP